MVRIYRKAHVGAILTFIFYVVLAFVLGSVVGILNSATFWISLVCLFISFVSLFVGFSKSMKLPTPSMFGMIDKPLFAFYYTEFCFGLLFFIINLCVKDKFPHLLNLIQIPILIIFIAWIGSVFARAKYIGDQVKEEKATVKMQRTVVATIDRSAASNYGFKVSDSIDALANKIRTMGLGTNENTAQIDSEIIENIKLLNSMMKTKRDEKEVMAQASQIEKLIEYRRESNRRY